MGFPGLELWLLLPGGGSGLLGPGLELLSNASVSIRYRKRGGDRGLLVWIRARECVGSFVFSVELIMFSKDAGALGGAEEDVLRVCFRG